MRKARERVFAGNERGVRVSLVKRPVCRSLFAYGFGIVFAGLLHRGNGLEGGIVFLSGLLVLTFFSAHSPIRGFGICMFFGLLGLCFTISAYQKTDAMKEAALDGAEGLLEGCVETIGFSEDGYVVTLSCDHFTQEKDGETVSLKGRFPRVLLYVSELTFRIGDRICVQGALAAFAPAANPGNFDRQEYYALQDIGYRVNAGEITVTGREKEARYVFGRVLFMVKARLYHVYRTLLATEEAGVLCTMLLGEKSLLEEEIRQLYQTGGISHLLAISGLHISMVGGLLYKFLRKCGASYASSGAVCAILVTFYACMTGMSLSSLRAVTMFWLLLFGNMVGRSYDSVTSLGIAGWLLLLKQPLWLFGASFQLSFLAVAGMVCLTRPVTKFLHLPEKTLVQNAIACLLIQLVTLPVSLYHFYTWAPYTVLVNAIVLPFAPALFVLGLLGGIAGTASLFFGRVLLFLPQKILLFYHVLCKTVAVLPVAVIIRGQPSCGRLAVYVLVLAGCFCIGAFLLREKRKWAVKRLAFLGMLLLCGGLLLYPEKESARIDVLDVGQGDGIYLTNGKGVRLFVDGGSTSVSEVGNDRILPYLKYTGADAVDLWFVTHTDADHISGLCEVLASGYPVGALVLPANLVSVKESGSDVPEEGLEELLQLAKEAGCRILPMAAGDSITLGKMKITCLHPAKEDDPSNENENSLVLYVTYLTETGEERTACLTGDLTADGESRMAQRVGVRGSIDFLKVAHHGSASSSSADFFACMQPKVAAISAGAGNRYGHPAEETLESLDAQGAEIYITFEGGCISYLLEDGTTVVYNDIR